MFLEYINQIHPNIKFTMETEINNSLPFLDVLISRTPSGFSTSVYRKNTFSGLGLNFFSFCSKNFKLNACRTLIYRAFHLSSNWISFHNEIKFLTTFFKDNCYPDGLLHSFTKTFLNDSYHPTIPTLTVPKLKFRLSVPFLGSYSRLYKKDLTNTVNKFFPFVELELIFVNPLKIMTLFKFKDRLQDGMRSNLVYLYTCPRCSRGNYVGCTQRLLKVRVDCHRGVSYRTDNALSRKEHSAIREHAIKCKHKLDYSHFKILASTTKKCDLPVLESLLIKQINPSLNIDSSSVPLYIA
jgi:hypothetical protein